MEQEEFALFPPQPLVAEPGAAFPERAQPGKPAVHGVSSRSR
jgi:hypothetical protein